jgi:NAD+ kinase
MLVTPICPHTLHMRPIATSIDSSVVVKVVDKAVLAGDGVRLAELNSGDSVAVTGSKRSVKLVRFERNSLFRRIRERLT